MILIIRAFSLLLFLSQLQCATRLPSEKIVDRELTSAVPLQNDPKKLKAPYVVMLSIDGYRYDYTELHQAQNLSALAAAGVSAKSLKPIYPSRTFPNHYSIVTGMYADRHGIVSNNFYDPQRKTRFALSDRKAVTDGSWYLAEPLWVTAAKQGLRTASFFWVGSEGEIQGLRPNHYYLYDETVPNSNRVDKVLAWLSLPEEKRPHLLLLYMSDVDDAGHKYGPNSPEVKAAVQAVDAQVGRLYQGLIALRETGLEINLVIVSDHGMHEVRPERVIQIDEPLLTNFITVGNGPQILIYLKPNAERKLVDDLYTSLKKLAHSNGHFKVHRREDMSAHQYDSSARAGDIVLEAELGWSLFLEAPKTTVNGGNHGWHPSAQNMHGIFIAEGPGFKTKKKVGTFENVNVYPAILKALELEIPEGRDGKLRNVKNILR